MPRNLAIDENRLSESVSVFTYGGETLGDELRGERRGVLRRWRDRPRGPVRVARFGGRARRGPSRAHGRPRHARGPHAPPHGSRARRGILRREGRRGRRARRGRGADGERASGTHRRAPAKPRSRAPVRIGGAVRPVANRLRHVSPRGGRGSGWTFSIPATLTRRGTSAFARPTSVSSSREISSRRAITRTSRTRTSRGCAPRSSVCVSFPSGRSFRGTAPRADARVSRTSSGTSTRREGAVRRAFDSGTEEDAREAVTHAFPFFRLRNRAAGARGSPSLVRPHHPEPRTPRTIDSSPGSARKEITRELSRNRKPSTTTPRVARERSRSFPPSRCATARDLSLAYTPGVAEPCLEIARDPELVYEYTAKGNLVAVIIERHRRPRPRRHRRRWPASPSWKARASSSRGSPTSTCSTSRSTRRTPTSSSSASPRLEPTFGGINLEDIKAPECFYIEEQLKAADEDPRLPRRPARHGDHLGRRVPERARARGQEDRGREGRLRGRGRGGDRLREPLHHVRRASSRTSSWSTGRASSTRAATRT